MNKKIIGIVIAVLVILTAIIGVVYLINNDILNKESNNDTSKALGTTITTDEEKTEEQAVLNKNVQEQNVIKNIESSKKILIAYFSRADENYSVGNVDVGNTEIMAGFIKDYLGDTADTFKIDPVKAYPTNYKECTEVATEELNSNARPEFKNANSLNMDNYDTIFIGYPIWWGDVPMIINTFLEKYDFSGKKPPKCFVFGTTAYIPLRPSRFIGATIIFSSDFLNAIARPAGVPKTGTNFLRALSYNLAPYNPSCISIPATGLPGSKTDLTRSLTLLICLFNSPALYNLAILSNMPATDRVKDFANGSISFS